MAYLGTEPANQVIDSTLIADGVISTSDLANGAVSPVKLSTGAPSWDISGNLALNGGIALQNNQGPYWNNGVAYVSYNTASNFLSVGVNSAERMRIDASGRVTTPFQPAFSAFSNVNNNVVYSAGQTIIFNSTRFNTGNNYNTSTGLFTAPIAGAYQFNLDLYSNDTTYARYRFLKNGSDAFAGQGGIAGGGVQCTLSACVYLDVNDYVAIVPAYNNSTVFQEANHTIFSGYLIG